MSDDRKVSNTRLSWLAGFVLLWALAIFAQLINLQVLHHSDYARQAQSQQVRTVEIPAPRGDIFDRNGQTLAMSVEVDTVFVNPMRLPDLAVAADVLAPVLKLNRKTLYQRLKTAKEERQGFLRVKRRLSRVESERLRSLKLEWIEFEKESQRHYPKLTVAAHVLGSVDHEENGNAGIELELDKELRGHPGRARLLTDVKRRGIESQVEAESRTGASLTLTIDERVQFAAERELKHAVEANRCKTGSVVVMNPQNGEILALASYPGFDPNKRPSSPEEQAMRLNVAVSAPGEPGSLFKVFTIAAGLEVARLSPESVMPCGRMTLGGRLVHEAKHFYEPLPIREIMAKSSNAGAAQIGLRVGDEKMDEYVRRFGFGRRTGAPLPAESPGMLRKLENWDPASVGYISFGHEIATTTLQLARACSVIANGGSLVRPQLVLKKQSPGTPVQVVEPEKPVRVLKPETSIALRRMMEGVVLEGTGKTAKLDGYTSGGKTGSAQIFDFETKHYTHAYNASFMGFAPVANPAIVVVVTINGAREYGGPVAGPAFAAVAQEALRVLDVPKDLPEVPPAPLIGPEPPPKQPTLIASALPPEPAPIAGQREVAGPRVPNFQGKTMRAVIEEATAMGLSVVVAGSGVARLQEPPPGSILPAGRRIRVQFTR